MIPVLCGAATLMGMNANAFQEDGCFAASVISADQNGTSVSADRSITSNALGAPDKNNEAGGFYSLGKGGSITLQLGGAVFNQPGPDLRIFETSFSGDDCGKSDDETAMIEVSEFGGLWVSLGEICRDGTVDFDGMPLAFASQIRITDTTTNGGDGYDVDGVMAINGCIDLDDENLCFASSVVEGSFMQGLTKKDKAVPADRSDATKALGEPEYVYIRNNETFVSLGYGGSIILGFDGVIYDEPGNDLLVVETTGTGVNSGASPAWVETAEILVSHDNVAYYSVGFANKFEAAQIDIADAVDEDGNPVVLEFIRTVKVQDVTPTSSISDDAYDLDGIVALNGCSEEPNEDPELCANFNIFYADNPVGGDDPSTLYRVVFEDGEAKLVFLSDLDFRAHIAYDTDKDKIYAVNNNGSGFDTIDPSTGISSGYTAFDMNLGGTPTAVYFEGNVFFGSNTGKIVSYNLESGNMDLVAEDLPISGGDLIVNGGDLYLATRSGNKLWLIEDGTPMNALSIPAKVNGLAILNDGGILMANADQSGFNILNSDGMDTDTDIPVTLNGESFKLRNGDLASGCNNSNNQEPGDDCLNFDYYYVDIPVSKKDPTTLYKVNFTGGSAELSIVSELDNRPHIAFNPEANQIYAVRENGSGFETIDAATNSSLGFTSFPFSAKSVTAVAYSNNILYIGSDKLNEVFEYNITDNTLNSIAKDVPVQGGDLVVVGDELYLATKQGGGTWYLISEGNAINAVDIPSNVNGATTTADGTILFANFGADAFKELTADGIVEIPVFLNGESFKFRHGDLGSGCTAPDTQEPCNPEVVNGGFELENTFAGGFSFVPQDDVPGWSTKAPVTTIEIQKSGLIDGNASNSGDFHFELNGDGLNNIYQEICTTPGENIAIRFAHKKRRANGTDKMELYLGGDLSSIESNTAIPYIANANMEWNNNVFVYNVPAGQTSTFVYFKAVSGTNNTVGNLLDDISVEPTFSPATDMDALLAALANEEQSEVLAEISMYPVPAKNRLNVKLTNRVSATVSYEIVSILGQSFNRGSVEAKSGQTEINADISNLADGTYFFVLNANGNTTAKQFVKAAR